MMRLEAIAIRLEAKAYLLWLKLETAQDLKSSRCPFGGGFQQMPTCIDDAIVLHFNLKKSE